MSKLFKLKDWLTVPDAARHLSTLFGEPVSDGDVLRLALDGRLTLSVCFVGSVLAKRKKIVPWGMVEKVTSHDGREVTELADFFSDECALVPDDGGQYGGSEILQGVFDLPMVSGGRLRVEREYQRLTNGPELHGRAMGGVIVRGDDGRYCMLMEDASDAAKPYAPPTYIPACELPSACVLVVRTSALQELCAELLTPIEKPVSTTERNTFLKLLIGMAVKGYNYDPKASKSTTPKEIADDLAGLGITITDDTVRKYLKEAAQAFLPESAKPSKPKSV